MCKVFLYDDKFDIGAGQFASVGGFKLVTSGWDESPEAIRDKDECIYGYIYEINDNLLDILDTYYGIGIHLHERIRVSATLQGGASINAYMYEYNMELV